MRGLLVTLVLVGVMLGLTPSAPAQAPPRIVEITMTSFKFEPNEITLTEGDRVVIRLRNADQFGRPHDIASRYFLDIPLVVRGDGRQAVEEGRKYVRVDAGRQAEFEFVAQGRGSYAFICSVLLHSINGMTGAIYVKPKS
jgi:plastocyanin